MIDTVVFSSNDCSGGVTIQCNGKTWTEQAGAFFNFLLAQGFIISEQHLAEFYADRAEEIGSFRDNIKYSDSHGECHGDRHGC